MQKDVRNGEFGSSCEYTFPWTAVSGTWLFYHASLSVCIRCESFPVVTSNDPLLFEILLSL